VTAAVYVRLELGDIYATDLDGIWFVDEVGGQELVHIRCVRPVTFGMEPGYATTTNRQVQPKHRRLIGKAIDFEHASAIVALMS
jgi:hypothetical protein